MSDRILVLGLGSPIISDDRIGLAVAERIEKMGLEGVDVRQEAIGGLDMVHMVMDYDVVVVVDAIQTKAYPPGSIAVLDVEDFDPTITTSSVHDINLATALHIGRQLEPERMPRRMYFVAIEAAELLLVSEEMTPEVEASIPEATQVVLEIIQKVRSEVQ